MLGFLCDPMQEVVRGVVSDIQAQELQEQKEADQVDKSRRETKGSGSHCYVKKLQPVGNSSIPMIQYTGTSLFSKKKIITKRSLDAPAFRKTDPFSQPIVSGRISSSKLPRGLGL